ncbi:MAG: hypothetical protein QOF73_3740, partial [Thermomicrobiales bacterium]|nr:hypothetical protein [Thermomicrobiales bacterium]
FENAVVDDFANVGQQRGRVDIELYFYRGCAAFN